MFEWFLIAFAVYYITTVLLFDIDAEEPFERDDMDIYLSTEGQMLTRPVSIFDFVRRIFGLYKVVDARWFVRTERLPLWECPVCLSFWVASFCVVSLVVLPVGVFYPIALAGFVTFLSQILSQISQIRGEDT